MMALTRLAAVLALVASSAQGHVQVQPSMVTYDTSTDITLTVPHGGVCAPTRWILIIVTFEEVGKLLALSGLAETSRGGWHRVVTP